MKREYLNYSIDEFFILGKTDALNYVIKDLNGLVNELNKVIGEDEIIKRIVSYLLGHKIGTLLAAFNRCENSVTYNRETSSFTYNNEDGKTKVVSFEKGYKSLKQESETEATTFLKSLRRN